MNVLEAFALLIPLPRESIWRERERKVIKTGHAMTKRFKTMLKFTGIKNIRTKVSEG